MNRSTNKIVGIHRQISLNLTDNFVKDDNLVTLVNFNVNPEFIANTQPEIDQCCPRFQHDDVRIDNIFCYRTQLK